MALVGGLDEGDESVSELIRKPQKRRKKKVDGFVFGDETDETDH